MKEELTKDDAEKLKSISAVFWLSIALLIEVLVFFRIVGNNSFINGVTWICLCLAAVCFGNRVVTVVAVFPGSIYHAIKKLK